MLGDMSGSFIPFARTKAEREKTGDPRLSIEERYSSRDDYLSKVKQAAEELVRQRFLLEGDVQACNRGGGGPMGPCHEMTILWKEWALIHAATRRNSRYPASRT